MRRTWRLLGPAALGAAVVVLAIPADGSALAAVFVALTPTGPSPVVLTISAGNYPVWTNQDTVPHAVVFANGLCSLQVAPGAYGSCPDGFRSYVGDYPYTIDGTVRARIVVVAAPRVVTLTAGSHRIERGAWLRLHGELAAAIPLPGPGPEQPVIVLARHDRYHPFRRIATVHANRRGMHLFWQLRVRPRARTIYIAEANSQPPGGQVWQWAWSRPFGVRFRR